MAPLGIGTDDSSAFVFTALEKPWHKVHTELEAAAAWFDAEPYHQQYLANGGRHGRAQSARKRCAEPIRCYG